ncbi:N-formylglutamate deformylase [Cribrihabitans marinus]|uniref:N-formylglutamate deformylase n=1 Tax=Cribrihabitans marinus TaxID=1227549 RepID=A0A1H7DX82_9RHOB|nr:N-formylglutamate amidohydrolase [Cribrihabitans marinus]GGH40538.1 N-formylglutamate amidohydrolase [Cribrihabitans marinus]SEK05984.1 N-formylglutamate deformylase [Cribrihabitans marinus]
MSIAPYYLSLPAARASCVVFASPHSGSDYPPEFLRRSVLDRHAIRSSEDAFVDLLFEPATGFGAPFLKAAAPRAYLDLNRAADELDPALIGGLRRHGHNPRVASGLGVIPRVVANGREIYRGKLAMAEAQARIDTIWRPYHARLQSLLDEARADFGQALLIDCHSMPREALESLSRSGARRPDIVLGDRFGASASAEIMEEVEAAFAGAGFRVVRNTPFAGAYVTQAYGRPSRNQHAVQVEIDRSLYMDESRIRPSSDFDGFRAALRTVVARIAVIGQTRMPMAAE